MKVNQIISRFESDTTPGKFYEVREGKDGRVYCTCWSWLRSPKNNKTCKHLKRIQNVLSSKTDRSAFRQSFGGEPAKSPWER